MRNDPNIEILEGWYWEQYDEIYPWEFLRGMYDHRMRLGKKNLRSLPFKLGPNSLYGKYAQTVGWNQKKREPPRSHALPIAAWITSYTRAILFNAMRAAGDSLIGVETDAIYATTAPETWNNRMGMGIMELGEGLGQWGVDVYDEVIYLQSGMALKRKGDYLEIRSRGMNRSDFTYGDVKGHLQGTNPFSPLKVKTRPMFIGLGAALQSKRPTKEVLGLWQAQERYLRLGTTDQKRIHAPKYCPQCQAGKSPWDEAHELLAVMRPDQPLHSVARSLPWEGKHPAMVERARELTESEKDLLTDLL